MPDTIRSAIKLMIGIVIFAGLPLLSWGVKDTPGFFGHPARLVYTVVIVLMQFFIVIKLPEVVLDTQFSIMVTVQEDHQLVTAGPYRYRRHPRYLGIVLFSLGFSWIYRSWLALILTAGLTMLLIGRIHIEEMLLHREFGSDWEAYSQKTWRLIPFIY